MHRIGLIAALFLPTVWANSPPQPVSVSPNNRQGNLDSFLFTFNDDDGASDITRVQVSIENTLTSTTGCTLSYTLATNEILIRDSSQPSGWSAPRKLGRPGILSNSRCNVDAGASSALSNGPTFLLRLALNFPAASAGDKTISAEVTDSAGVSSDWQTLGSWNVPSPGTHAPLLVSLNPASVSGTTQSFELAFDDPDGAGDIAKVHLLIGDASGINACDIEYRPQLHQVALRNDAGDAWLDPAAEGGPNNTSNSQCLIDMTQVHSAGSGMRLTTTLHATLKSTVLGSQAIYAEAIDSSGLSSGIQRMGLFIVAQAPNDPPAPISITPNGTTTRSDLFRLVIRDANSASDVQRVQILFGRGFNSANACLVYVSIPDGTLSLLDDAGRTFSPPCAPPESAQSRTHNVVST